MDKNEQRPVVEPVKLREVEISDLKGLQTPPAPTIDDDLEQEI